MKFKTYYMDFSSKLMPEQEDILVGELKTVVDLAQKKLDDMIQRLNSSHIKTIAKFTGTQTTMELLAHSLSSKKIKMLDYIQLGTDDGQTYKLCIASGDLSLLDQKLTLFGKELYNTQVVDDKRIMEHLQNYVFPLMKVKKGSVKIEIKEEEVA